MLAARPPVPPAPLVRCGEGGSTPVASLQPSANTSATSALGAVSKRRRCSEPNTVLLNMAVMRESQVAQNCVMNFQASGAFQLMF